MAKYSQKKYPVLELLLGAGIVFFIGLLLGSGNINKTTTFTSFCYIVAYGLLTTSGIFVIIQKEAPRPGLPSVKGVGAVITGVLTVLMWGTFTVFELVSFIKDLLQK
jgi:amino acid transporter